ncbi:MAG: FAD-dependent oxidoreductase [Pseudomonadota bacterium]
MSAHPMERSWDVAVVGGGLLGSAIGYGLAKRGLRAVILDEGDEAFRAARGNFGLVWVQGKGARAAPYARWTQESAALWPDLAAALEAETGTALQLEQMGGIHVCLSEEEFETRGKAMASLAAQPGSRFDYEMLGRNALARHLPGLGPDVVGGSWSAQDGHVDPLRLLSALQQGFVRAGGTLRPGHRVTRVAPEGSGFLLEAGTERLRAGRIVLAAGLGNAALAPMLGLRQPVRPQKGQVLVAERMPRFLELPTTHIRQTGEGTVLLGDSKEEAGFDTTSTPGILRQITDRARRTFPMLAHAQIVRSWAALRVMTPDGLPVYDRSSEHPGAFAAACHSGVTLAAAHAGHLAGMVVEGRLGGEAATLGPGRFDVQAA